MTQIVITVIYTFTLHAILYSNTKKIVYFMFLVFFVQKQDILSVHVLQSKQDKNASFLSFTLFSDNVSKLS